MLWIPLKTGNLSPDKRVGALFPGVIYSVSKIQRDLLCLFHSGRRVKSLPAMWETWVRSLGWADPLQKGMATHSSILAWGIHMDGVAW